jgi:hypothetical protein
MDITLSESSNLKVLFFSPTVFHNQVFSTIQLKGLDIFFKEDFYITHHQLFWNLLLYFRLLNLPAFPINLCYNPENVELAIKQLRSWQILQDRKLDKGLFLSPTCSAMNKTSSKIDEWDKIKQLSEFQSSKDQIPTKPADSFSSKSFKRSDSVSSNKSDNDKKAQSGTNANKYIVKIFGPFLCEFRRNRTEIKYDMLGKQVHDYFKLSSEPKVISNFQKQVNPLKLVPKIQAYNPLNSNDLASSIIFNSKAK